MNPKFTLPATLPYTHQLNHLLNSLAGKVPVHQVFLSHIQTSGHPFLIIQLACCRLPDGLLPEKRIRKAWSRYGIHLMILAGTDLRKHLKLGTLFLHRHCNASTRVFTSGGQELPAESLPRSLKKFRVIRQKYAISCHLMRNEIRKAEAAGSFITAYHLYTSLFEHHLFHLEFLCLGRYFLQDTLDKRLLRLEPFFPEIRSFLLQKTGNTYFITEALLSAGKAETGKEYSHLRAEFREAIVITEKKLYNLVRRTFRDIKAAAKQPDTLPEDPIEKKTVSPYESVISILTQSFRIEEIFLFHREELVNEGRNTTELYLLLIGKKINRKDLDVMRQTVSRKTGRKFSVVPVAHSAGLIQEHLWESQPFFPRVMQPENAVYTNSYPAVVHWHPQEADLYTDEEITFQQLNGLYKNYKTLRSQKQPSDAKGIRLVIKDIFQVAFLLIIYNRVHYRPAAKTDLPTLWKLCMYAGPEAKASIPLIRNLPFDLFRFLEQAENPEENTDCWDENVLGVVDRLLVVFVGLTDI